MSETVSAQPDGAMLPLDSLEQTFAYAGANVISITVEYPPGSGVTYVQSFTYSGDNVATISGWVKQ